MKLKISDEIIITGGKDKGRSGKIEMIYPKEDKVLVPGINVYKKARRATGDQAGGMFDISRPLNVANVALICPHCKKPTRIGWQVEKVVGRKIRVCRKCGKEIDTVKPEKGKKKK